MNPGDPGLETWPSLDAARHGGGPPWVPGVYDPETNLYIFGTGNPTPAYTPAGRGTGVGLFTCSLIAVNVDTGKMAWYYQTSPRDMHDWDSAQTPILIDAVDQRQAAKAGLDRCAQWLLLHRRSRDGQIRRERQVRHRTPTGRGNGPAGPADPRSGEGRDDSGRDRQQQRHQLAAARVLARHRTVLRAREQHARRSSI